MNQQLEGPRLLRREELIDSIRLSHICFGGPEKIDNDEEILANYGLTRRGGWYVLSHQGKPVSQIAIFHDQLKMYEGTIQVGSIGGVCTHPDYRKQGLATRLMEHCTEQLVNEGARLMLISGDEGVYLRLGNVFQGKYTTFSIQPGQGVPSTSSDLLIRRATEADAQLCNRLHKSEPVHFVRKKADFVRGLHDPMSNTYVHADPWIIERSSQAVAYLFLGFLWGLPDGMNSGIRHVGEYAGSRLALVDALDLLITRGDLKNLSWHVAWQDVELIQLLQDRGYIGNITPLDGATCRIINFPGLMRDLHPMLQARLDAKLLRGLRFEQRGPLLGGIGNDRYTIIRGSERLELDGAEMTCLVMGNADTRSESIPKSGALAEVISAIYPLPSFLPGLNYH